MSFQSNVACSPGPVSKRITDGTELFRFPCKKGTLQISRLKLDEPHSESILNTYV